MRTGSAAIIVAGLIAPIAQAAQVSLAPPPAASGLPGLQNELQCTKTAIKGIGNRLLGTPGSGSAVSYTNGGYQVGYDELPEISRARVGDPVFMCLISIPTQCPSGDTRGRVYTVTDLRTKESWTLADSPHSCGGA